jgi:hypothetical protein
MPIVGSPTVQVQPTSAEDFITGLKVSLEKPLIQSPPHLCVSRVRVENLVPHRSDRLASKSIYRDPKVEKQAKRVMLGKCRHRQEPHGQGQGCLT